MIENPILFAGVILSAVGMGVVIGVTLIQLWRKGRSRRFRVQHGIPDIIGNWQCQWFDDATVSEHPKVEDTVEIRNWKTNGEFVAQGFQPQFHLSYPLVGEIDPSRIVTVEYRAARYPFEPNRGVACMELSRDGSEMEGHWFGRRYSGGLGGGKVKWVRLQNR